MANNLGLIFEMLLMIGIPIFIPFVSVYIAGHINYNQKIKTITLMILSAIYNAIVGFYTFSIMFCTSILISSKTYILVPLLLLMFTCILIPINIYVISKIKINKIMYIVLSIMMIIIGFIVYFISLRIGVSKLL